MDNKSSTAYEAHNLEGNVPERLDTITSESSGDTERPLPSNQQTIAIGRKNPNDQNIVEEDDDEDEYDPAQRLKPLDWTRLEENYHDAMNKCDQDEAALTDEWAALMNFFQIWAQSGHTQETDRSFKRLKTRMAHVQRSEESIEKTRLHYVNVVQAFESAMQLLNGVTG